MCEHIRRTRCRNDRPLWDGAGRCLCSDCSRFRVRRPHRSEPEDGGGWGTLATYRCQDATNRLTIGFRVCEGAPATLQAYVVPAIPPKACSTVSYRCARRAVQY